MVLYTLEKHRSGLFEKVPSLELLDVQDRVTNCSACQFSQFEGLSKTIL